MIGSIKISPGFIFRDEKDITTANLNSAANPTFTIEDGAITRGNLDNTVCGPVCTVDSDPAASLTLALDANRAVNNFFLTLTRNVTSLTISNQVAGHYGVIMVSNPAKAYTLKLPTNVWLAAGAGGPYTITPGVYHLIEFFVVIPSTRLFMWQNDLDL